MPGAPCSRGVRGLIFQQRRLNCSVDTSWRGWRHLMRAPLAERAHRPPSHPWFGGGKGRPRWLGVERAFGGLQSPAGPPTPSPEELLGEGRGPAVPRARGRLGTRLSGPGRAEGQGHPSPDGGVLGAPSADRPPSSFPGFLRRQRTHPNPLAARELRETKSRVTALPGNGGQGCRRRSAGQGHPRRGGQGHTEPAAVDRARVTPGGGGDGRGQGHTGVSGQGHPSRARVTPACPWQQAPEASAGQPGGVWERRSETRRA